jgi:predicted GNAT family N-acyltransferase
VLIGRLARSVAARGQGIGELLVADALTRVLSVSDSIAAYAIVVEAKNAGAVSFYASLGFVPFPDSPQRLFLLSATAQAAILSSRK